MSQFAVLPDPGLAHTLDEVAACLRLLKTWAGNPSYETITARVNTRRPPGEQVGKTTVVDCFRAGRRRLDPDLVVAVVEALHADAGYTNQWRQALRVASGETRGAGSQVRVLGSLPGLPAGFVSRTPSVGPAPLSVLSGMAGAGKTTLALQAAHRLAASQPFDRVLAVNLRGSHADQPPAGPDAVLDGFLRLLGVPGQHLPHGLAAQTTAYRNRLSGTRVLVLLDDAASDSQVRPLLAPGPGSVTLITSRRRLDGLTEAAQVEVGVFRPGEARDFLLAALPPGADPAAADRIAATCGYLPLALARVVAHMRERPGWTLADHADWLAERRRSGRLDPSVRQALDVSYRNLPGRGRDLLRLLAHHPGRSFDAPAAEALAGAAAGEALRDLAANHLLLPAGPSRWAMHDLVRVYAAGRSADEDRRSDRRAALNRLFDHLRTTGADPADLAAAADYAAAEGWALDSHRSAK
ncbi:NB-ARC domain-containing protein [Actinoplanes sp. Pm04-4]|uniref:NB-ARC domain-containing protein n=1 Tax=Paractinoplanes pyxinae TaxID=2997416 RepID=A0ABT4B5P7_9ACTN|nr:NB-ARC domain-containing protein [Actinoplanes pyxinae]MCY1140955.1 NB-ARC domain-containing protein [Actinoplanes pyxinae]